MLMMITMMMLTVLMVWCGEGDVDVDDDDFSLIIDDNEKIHALENNDDEKFKMMSTICTSRSLLIWNVLLEHSKLEQALLYLKGQ